MALDGLGQRRDTWVLMHLLLMAWHFGGKSSLLQHACPHQSNLGHGGGGGGGGGWLGVLRGDRMECSLYRSVCMSLPWWSRGCNESSFTEPSSCPLSKIPLDCSGMTRPLPLSLCLPPPCPPSGPKSAQNGRHPSEAAILGAQTVASLGMGLCLHGNLRPPLPAPSMGVGSRKGVLQAWLRYPSLPFPSQRPRGD